MRNKRLLLSTFCTFQTPLTLLTYSALVGGGREDVAKAALCSTERQYFLRCLEETLGGALFGLGSGPDFWGKQPLGKRGIMGR